MSDTATRRIDVRPTTTDGWMFGWWVLNALCFAHVVLFPQPLLVTYAYNALLYVVGAAIASVDRTVRKLFVLATVAGVVELGVDRFLVEVTGTLVYPESAPMLLSSPLYMPLAWAIVTTQLGYLASRLDDTVGATIAALVPAGLAMGLIGVYETGARLAGIWAYESAPLLMVGNAPLYILLAEGVMFASLWYFARWDAPVVAGVGFGAVISASYVGSYYLLVAIAAVG